MRRGVRMLPVAGCAWVSAAASTLWPALAAPLAVGVWAAAFGVTLVLLRRGGTALALVVLALVAAGAVASHVAFAQPTRDAAGGLAVSGGRAVEVTVVVTGKAETWTSGVVAFDGVATRIRIGEHDRALRAEVQVRTDVASGVAPGATVLARGTARPADPGERAVLVVTASRALEVVTPPTGVLAVADALRASLVRAVGGLPEPGAGLVPGLAVGDTSIVDAGLDAAMKASSLSHLTAVSGANCALVVGLAFAAAAGCGAPRGVRVGVALAALAGFVVLVTPEPSVVRAAAMAAVAMLGLLIGRTAAGASILALAVAVLLVADPWLSTSIGFALSAVATASLLLFARPLATGLSRWMPRALALALSVPLAAQLACGPVLVLIAPAVPVYGVVANLLAGPAAPVATVVGLAACLAAPVPWVQSGLAAIAWLPASWISATALMFSAMPGAQLPWIDGLAGLAALAVIGLAVGVVVAGRGAPFVRRGSALLLSIALGVAAGGAALSGLAGRWTLPPEWAVLACDVGQGDAVLVRSAGRVALVDTGPDPALLSACLSRAGVDRVDLLVLTHFDLDHAGGLAAVAGRVGTLVHGPPSSPQEERLVQTAGERTLLAHAGMRGTLGEAEWRVVWPPARSRAFPAGNDASVVLEVAGGGVPRALFLGDLSAAPQRALAASGTLRPPYPLVKVAHHGSADQDAALYRLLEPSVALLTVGADNDYDHPRDETLALLTAAGARIARTDAEGIVAVSLSPAGILLWRERDVGAAG